MREIAGLSVQASRESDWFHLGVTEDFCLVLRRVTGLLGLASGKEIIFVDYEYIKPKEYKTAKNWRINVIGLEDFGRNKGVVSTSNHGDIYYRCIESWKVTKKEERRVFFKYCVRKKFLGLMREEWFEFVSETDWEEVNENSN